MSQIIIHTFSKAEVESLDFKRFDQIFADWPNQRNGLLRNKMNCLVWQVDGYNEHPDELYHISEVRSFYRELLPSRSSCDGLAETKPRSSRFHQKYS